MVLCLILFFFKKAPMMAILKGVQKKLVLNFGCAHISASIHRIFKIFVSNPHNWGCIMGGRHKNFKDPMYRS